MGEHKLHRKILFVDISLGGHRLGYLNTLLKCENECYAYIPYECSDVIGNTIVDSSGFCNDRNFINYIKFLYSIKKVVRENKIDIIHFLCGDALYRFFGTFLKIMHCPIIITYHHVQFNRIRNYSLKKLFKYSKYGVVHTSDLKKSIENIGIQNVKQIEYPVFNRTIQETMMESRKYFGLPEDKLVIVAIGATSKYKGLDILLKALERVNSDYCLLIAGKPTYFDKTYINSAISVYKENVCCVLRVLSDKEFSKAINASNYIALPYRKNFDGASGPLAEGVWYRKSIIGSNHGSLGSLIRSNDLGYTFVTEDINDLSKTLNSIFQKKKIWSDTAEKYRNKLTVNTFLKSYYTLYEQI